MWNLSIAGKITVFKALAISKIVYLALVKVIAISTIRELIKIKKHFIKKMAILKLSRTSFVKIMKMGLKIR